MFLSPEGTGTLPDQPNQLSVMEPGQGSGTRAWGPEREGTCSSSPKTGHSSRSSRAYHLVHTHLP